jgi:geranylgeranyl diphosphate synthase type 3
MANTKEKDMTGYLRQPVEYLSKLPGRDFRKVLTYSLARDHGLQENTLALSRVEKVVTRIHNASLLVDDVQDNAKERRGHPCAHALFGKALTINAAYLDMFELINDISLTPAARSAVSKVLIDLHKGQGLDLQMNIKGGLEPTLDNYNRMAALKTGSLFVLIEELLSAESHGTKSADPKIYKERHANIQRLGVFFQKVNDVQDYTSHRLEDFNQAKPSFPTILGKCVDALRERILGESLSPFSSCLILAKCAIQEEGKVLTQILPSCSQVIEFIVSDLK